MVSVRYQKSRRAKRQFTFPVHGVTSIQKYTTQYTYAERPPLLYILYRSLIKLRKPPYITKQSVYAKNY